MNSLYQTRIINTVSLFIAMCKTWTVHVPELPLPFSFEEFYQIAKQQINHQSEDLASSNRLSVFFDTIAMLYTQGQIIAGREFEIVEEKRITITKSRTETEETNWHGETKKVLYLIINDVIQIYQKLHGAESLKLNALRTYLRDNPAYLGQIKSHRFIYEIETWEPDPMNKTANLIRVKRKAERNTSCIAMDYDKLTELGIDLDKMKNSGPPFTSNPNQTPVINLPIITVNGKETDDDLPF